MSRAARCSLLRPSLSLAVSAAPRLAARARSMSRWLPRVMVWSKWGGVRLGVELSTEPFPAAAPTPSCEWHLERL
eukprot:CAMPEP_0119105276 /NCGR_PEP_ID=MMETSP1180-20130426/3284_1 /TAXON_ID=3052 ORGANISM="Chlamydomonas cf sp, Strain CCMP681" /NCGR_SAMPLE_ID=MMETSP1180 /ASSEMBLY_ACC=CAM_ASM_000741 /LENGTH=74 /DNA_ID=CAMNT_0007090285 /DNA_START=251 /DNA_END=475 /DNA_ORIENTATION=-